MTYFFKSANMAKQTASNAVCSTVNSANFAAVYALLHSAHIFSVADKSSGKAAGFSTGSHITGIAAFFYGRCVG
ncbi:MAG: hypothetical protein LUC20_07975, partial [Oscillospiraceae bacterium]|nr:hypothetical protein [Oscillospiraceae bacterium]